MEVDKAVKTFWEATGNDDDAAAREALASIPAEVVNECDDDDYDMLIAAVQNGNGCAVRALLASGKCDLDHRENICGMTAEEFSYDYPEGSPVRRAFAEYRDTVPDTSRSLLAKLLAGEADIRDYDVDEDFDRHEIEILLAAGVVSAKDISEGLAATLILERKLSYADRPFADFSHERQLFLLSNGAVPTEGFDAGKFVASLDADEWINLLHEPRFAGLAPWEKLRDEGAADDWFKLLGHRPQYADRADWERICREGSLSDCFNMLSVQPDLYERCQYKDELIYAELEDPEYREYWIGLIVSQPRLADVCDLSLFGGSERARVLMHHPELTWKFKWHDGPPVKLLLGRRDADDASGGEWHPVFTYALRTILQEALGLPDIAPDIDCLADEISGSIAIYASKEERKWHCAGIWSRSDARQIAMQIVRMCTKAELPIVVRTEELSGNETKID